MITVKTERLKLSQIKPNPTNPRRIGKIEMGRLIKSLQDFPEMLELREIIVDENNIILGGNMRCRALKQIGEKECIAKIVTGLTLDQKREFIIKDNSGFGEYDMDMLANQWSDLPLVEWGVSLPEDWLTGDKSEAKEDDFDAEAEVEIIKCPVTQPGQIWTLGKHRIMCGDSTKTEDVKRLMGGAMANIVFADPPYGVDIVRGGNKQGKVGGAAPTKFRTGTDGASKIVPAKEYRVIEGDETTETAKAFYSLCKSMNLKNIILWGGNYFTDFLPPSRCWFVWDKEMTGNFSEAEMAWTSFDKGGIRVFKYLWNGLSREGERRLELRARVHPTQKPVGLFMMILQRFCFLKVVFDGFAGSGSTLIACEETGRICYGMEIDPVYCDVIVRRWENLTGKKAVLEDK